MTVRWAKLALVILFAVYSMSHSRSFSTDWNILDDTNIGIHETGHQVFSMLGRFITIAGGSLFQLLVPLLIFGYFWTRGQKFSAAAVLIWLSVNFFYVAWYAADAQTMALQLFGGEGVTHDWNELLDKTGLLPYTAVVSNFIYMLGCISIAAGLYVAGRACVHKPEDIESADTVLRR